jgi:lipase chaperone LimK
MQDNNAYNLMKQYVQEHKSLWRINKDYIGDAEGHADVVEFWTRMQKDKEEHLKELGALIKKYHN